MRLHTVTMLGELVSSAVGTQRQKQARRLGTVTKRQLGTVTPKRHIEPRHSARQTLIQFITVTVMSVDTMPRQRQKQALRPGRVTERQLGTVTPQ